MMTIDTQIDADLSAPVVSEDVKPEQNISEGTAPPGVVDDKKQVEPSKTFTQAEVDAMVQKRLLKEERRVHRRVEQQLREQAEAKTREVEPRRDEFGDDRAYFEAQIEHLAEKKAAQKLADRERTMQHEKTQEAFLERAESAKSRYADFDAVVSNPALPINEGMAEFISDSDAGPDLAYFLGKNPFKAAEIAQLSPIKAARELTRLEAELAAKPKPRTSNAPAPIVPIGGASGGSKSPAEMSDAEYAKWRKTARK